MDNSLIKPELPENKKDQMRTTVLDRFNLNEQEFQAIQSKFLGQGLKEISLAVGLPYARIRKYFMRTGRLRKPYLEFCADMNSKSNSPIEDITMDARKNVPGVYEQFKQLGENPETHEAVRFKVYERLMSIAGVNDEVTIRGTLEKWEFEKSIAKLRPIFLELFGKDPFGGSQRTVTSEADRAEVIASLEQIVRAKILCEKQDEKVT